MNEFWIWLVLVLFTVNIVVHQREEDERIAELVRVAKRWPSTRQKDYVEKHPDLPPHIRQAIIKGHIMFRMSADQVHASWGDSMRINLKNDEFGQHEFWVYKLSGNARIVLQFTNGILVITYDDPVAFIIGE